MSDAKIPLMRNTFIEDQKTRRQLAAFLLRATRLSMGEQCAAFEAAFARWHGRKHAILVTSGSSANLVLLQALSNLDRLPIGARVGFSALTWATNIMPILQSGFVPVPVDVDPYTLNVMSYTLADRILDAKLDALFTTNVLGHAGDLNAVRDLCDHNGILLLEDNCESLGTRLYDDRTGNFGAASTCSFYVAHHMSTIEGGAILTDDDELAEMCVMVRAHGWDRSLSAERQADWRSRYEVNTFDAKYTFYDLAYNARPTEITGFLGLTQLAYLDDNITTRQRNHLQFEAAAKLNPDFIPVDHSHIQTLSSFCFPVLCRDRDLRNAYIRAFTAAGIECRPMIAGNMQRQPFYAKYVQDRYDLLGADMVHDTGFYFGNYPELTDDDKALILRCLSERVAV